MCVSTHRADVSREGSVPAVSSRLAPVGDIGGPTAHPCLCLWSLIMQSLICRVQVCLSGQRLKDYIVWRSASDVYTRAPSVIRAAVIFNKDQHRVSVRSPEVAEGRPGAAVSGGKASVCKNGNSCFCSRCEAPPPEHAHKHADCS